MEVKFFGRASPQAFTGYPLLSLPQKETKRRRDGGTRDEETKRRRDGETKRQGGTKRRREVMKKEKIRPTYNERRIILFNTRSARLRPLFPKTSGIAKATQPSDYYLTISFVNPFQSLSISFNPLSISFNVFQSLSIFLNPLSIFFNTRNTPAPVEVIKILCKFEILKTKIMNPDCPHLLI